jgi:putative addiction module killer protein
LTVALKVEEYLTEAGKNHYREWFSGLPVEYASKVAAARARMMAGSLGNVKPLDGTLKEYRIDWGPGIRIYIVQDGDKLIVLLGGGTKSGQQADIKQAKELRDEYDARKARIKKGSKG